ncbi:MAG: divergent polysaccharide deacetylase family protein [Campylobacter sp.]|nr:divergent polysaccharide deacetylase family protein [Campylobacter sp.]
MATKKTTKGRSKKRPDYAKFAFIVVLCFLSGAFSYGVLDLIFSKKQNLAEVSISQEKVQNLPNSQNKNEKTKQISQKPKQNDIKNEANLTFLTSNIPNLQNKPLNSENQALNLEPKQEENSNTTLPIKPPFDGKKPKLAIIMDDISEAGQIAKIKKLPVAVTPSIFPPSAKNPHTPNLSKGFESFSIHLPLEALNYTDNLKTIKTNASYEEIEQAVAKLRKDFPNAKFINNHTGSKFTGDENAMNLLIRALFRYDFYFVDSRTIGKTAVKGVVGRYRMRYAYRDIFLDNIDSVAEVRIKLKEAVQIAKKKGYAIAIGHPKNATFGALANSSDILDEVEVVYLDEIYEYYK